MKLLCIAALLTLIACDPQSSPEGRSIIRDEQIQAQINLLKEQNKALLDSITLVNHKLKTLK